MDVARMLLQSGFMISHSQACCCRGGSRMCYSRPSWLTYNICTHTHTA